MRSLLIVSKSKSVSITNLFFTYDLEHYRNSLRGFYFGFENRAPDLIIKTMTR
ncbi:CDP-glycerol glycerophosphotransferase family protein [Staphylococcus nepalensis]|uniref:CDP-glycerol glycerophosphotransferase family protein n=1 Tax=Staphylococcus nepalensis TaxID=214473 RepID=UPI002FE2FE0C